MIYFDLPEGSFKVSVSGGGFLIVTLSLFLTFLWGILPGDFLAWTGADVVDFHH
ncbi:MAG: hypothetical protein HQL81_12125 [Magnetococcales bacterium]|nr:hypothetical protein [Magnetococcales bacterium]